MEIPYNNLNREYTIEKGCPWYEAQQAYGPPNVNWCEPTNCTYINEPANTWSNLGYILIALAFIRKINEPMIRIFGLCVFFMGLLSGVYHATNNYFTQFFDFVGMFFMMSFLLAFNLQRLVGNNPRKINAPFWFFMFVNTCIFMSFDIMNIAVQKIILINASVLIVMDILAGLKESRIIEYKFFLLSIFFLAVAQAFSVIDIKRIYCNPENVFLHGHALWHLCGAIGMLFAGLHVKRMLRYRM